jgi:hypothetical protein
MAAQTNLVGGITGNMVYLAAVFTMTHGAIRNITVLGVTVGTIQISMLARVFLEIRRRPRMAVYAHITGDIGQIQRAMGIGMAIVAINHERLLAMRVTVTGNAFGQGIFVAYPAGGIGVINLMAEGTYLLMPMALSLQQLEHADMTLSALLHLQWFYGLVIQGRTRWYRFDLSGQSHLGQPGLNLGCGQHNRGK